MEPPTHERNAPAPDEIETRPERERGEEDEQCPADYVAPHHRAARVAESEWAGDEPRTEQDDGEIVQSHFARISRTIDVWSPPLPWFIGPS